jgi:hypothetical protein
MLLVIANIAKSAQICPKLPKIAKIYPQTISSRNFEIPPKIEILVFFIKQLPGVERTPKHVYINKTLIFHIPFSMSRNGLCM